MLSCGYRNGTDRMVIVRCVGPEAFFLERVVFPFELLSFQSPPETELEIWTHGLGGAELLESIPVSQLLLEHQTPEGLGGTGGAAPDPVSGRDDLLESWAAAG